MSKKTLKFMAMHNSYADNLLGKLLSGLTDTELNAPRAATQHGSLQALYTHLIAVNAWEMLVLKSIGQIKTTVIDPTEEINLVGYNPDDYTAAIEGEKPVPFETAKKHLAKLDDIWHTIIDNASGEELEREVDFFGKMMAVEELITGAFSHSIHHRGQISRILDQLGITHDLVMGEYE